MNQKNRLFSLSSAHLLVVPAMLLLTNSSWSTPIAIVNAGFENPVLVDGGSGFTGAWQWGAYDVTDPEIWYPYSDFADVYDVSTSKYVGGMAAEGENMGWLIGVADYDYGMSQILSDTLLSNSQYVLTVKVGNPYAYNQGLAPGFRIELLAGGVLLASTSGASPVDDSSFLTVNVTFNSGVSPTQLGQPLEIRLIAKEDRRDDSYEIDFDDVQLTVTPVDTAPLVLEIFTTGDTLRFEWNSRTNKLYDLVSSTDLNTSISTWLPYNDGVTTYENITASGNGANNLTNVLKVGPKRFFGLVEKPVPPLADE